MPPETPETPERVLEAGIAALGLRLDADQIASLWAYLDLLERWNRAYNLTAISARADMVVHHLLDSLSIASFLEGDAFVDVGTGAGLPGIPLAIALPHKRFVLLDSNGKKTRFLLQVRTALALANARDEQARARDHRPASGYDGVISRAFAALPAMLADCGHLLKPGGRFYAMKGRYPAAELRQVAKPYNVLACHPLRVPGLDGQRHLIVLASCA